MDSVPLPLSNVTVQNNEVTYAAADDVTKLPQDTIQGRNSIIVKQSKLPTIMSTASHILITGFTIYILYLSFRTYSLFSWHPSFMTIGAFLLMAEAVMAMSPDNILSNKFGRQARVRMHWILQAGATACIFAGFLIIVINKNMHSKPHFQSWHAIIGLITVILVGITSSGGVITLYSIKLKQLIRPAQIKLIHNILGIITFIVGVVCLIVGLYTGWFHKNASVTAQVICTILVAMSAILILESAVKSAYNRIKANFQST